VTPTLPECPRSSPASAAPRLVRGLTLFPATALNMTDMIGAGPFITLPLMVAAMGGPQALYGWIAGAVVSMSDGLIWAELGAAMPKAGGSYEYLEEIYGRRKLGRLLSFLFVFQVVLAAPVSMATGCIGLAGYSS
jgi:APA family basic amino acid/polyamine antiporter